jgi:hypothetical protein
MQEGDELACGPVEGLLVNQADTGSRGLTQLGVDVIGPERDMVHAFPAFGEKLRNRAFRCGRLQQLQMHATGIKKRGAHFLRRNFLATETFEAQRFFVEGNRFVQLSDRDTEVINGLDHNRVGFTVALL